MKVLRVWLDGQSSGSTKVIGLFLKRKEAPDLTIFQGTQITSYSGLEPDTVGSYNDQVLELYDDFMFDAYSYGIKVGTLDLFVCHCTDIAIIQSSAANKYTFLQLSSSEKRCLWEAMEHFGLLH